MHGSQFSTWWRHIFCCCSKGQINQINRICSWPLSFIYSPPFTHANLFFVHTLLRLQRLRYFLDPNNLVEWVLYVSTAVFIAPVLFNDSDCLNMEAGAVAVFLAWFNCLLFLQRYTALNQIKYLVITAIILYLYKQNHQFEILVKKLKWQKITCLIFAKFIIRMENWINSFTYNFFIIKTEVFIFCYQDAR